MGYLNELLSRNPLVIDGDTIRPQHKYTDDLYTGGIKMAMDKNIKLTINGNSAPKQTNYDRIKSMSVEEMAEFLFEYVDCDFCPVSELCKTKNYENCKKSLKKWLLQEVREDE
jgi:hypothetical protein